MFNIIFLGVVVAGFLLIGLFCRYLLGEIDTLTLFATEERANSMASRNANHREVMNVLDRITEQHKFIIKKCSTLGDSATKGKEEKK